MNIHKYKVRLIMHWVPCRRSYLGDDGHVTENQSVLGQTRTYIREVCETAVTLIETFHEALCGDAIYFAPVGIQGAASREKYESVISIYAMIIRKCALVLCTDIGGMLLPSGLSTVGLL